MATDQYGLFWNSQNGDRTYDADSFEKWLSRFFTTGVFKGDLAVSAGSGMTVSVAAGYVNINGKVRLFDGNSSITLETSDTVSPRIDTIVMERNDDTRSIYLKAVKGTASANPVAVSPVRTGSVYQLVLAHIYVGAGVSEITSGNITDKRDDASLCGSIQCTLNNFLYGETDLTAGTSDLATGTFYFKYD